MGDGIRDTAMFDVAGLMPRHAQYCSGAAKIQTAANHDRLKYFLRLAALRIALYEEQLCAL